MLPIDAEHNIISSALKGKGWKNLPLFCSVMNKVNPSCTIVEVENSV